MRDRFVRSANAALVSLVVVNFYFFSFEKFFKTSEFFTLVKPNFCLHIFIIVIMVENVLLVFLESFVFSPFASTVLSKIFSRTRKIITKPLSIGKLSTYARSIHQNASLNLANGFFSMIYECAGVNFVLEGLNAKFVSPSTLVDCWFSLNGAQILMQHHFVFTSFAAFGVRISKKDHASSFFVCGILIQN